MKKYLKLLFVALFATMTLSLVSCSDDKDEPDGEVGSIVGTWKVEGLILDSDWWHMSYFDFEEGGTCTGMSVVYFMGEYDVEVYPITWSQSGKSVIIDGDKGTITKMTSNSMKIKEDKYGVEITYTRCSKEEMNKYLKYVNTH